MSKTLKRLLWGYVIVIAAYVVLAIVSSRENGVVLLDDLFNPQGKSAGR